MDISFGNPENAHIFGRREQAPALRYPKNIFIFNSSTNWNLHLYYIASDSLEFPGKNCYTVQKRKEGGYGEAF